MSEIYRNIHSLLHFSVLLSVTEEDEEQQYSRLHAENHQIQLRIGKRGKGVKSFQKSGETLENCDPRERRQRTNQMKTQGTKKQNHTMGTHRKTLGGIGNDAGGKPRVAPWENMDEHKERTKAPGLVRQVADRETLGLVGQDSDGTARMEVGRDVDRNALAGVGRATNWETLAAV